MSDVIVNGQTVELPQVGQETVADVVGLVSSELDTAKRVVSVKLNGEDITGIVEKHHESLSPGMRIEVTTGNAAELAIESLGSMMEFHGDLESELNRAAEEFRMGSFERSNDIFARCLDGLKVLLSTTMSVGNLLQVRPEDVQAGQMDMQKLTSRIAEVLNEMIEAQMSRDSILLADLIEYELQPLLEDWHKGLGTLKQRGEAAA